MPNIHIFLPGQLNKAIEKEAERTSRAKSDIIHLTLIRAFLGEAEFKKEIEATKEEPQEETEEE